MATGKPIPGLNNLTAITLKIVCSIVAFIIMINNCVLRINLEMTLCNLLKDFDEISANKLITLIFDMSHLTVGECFAWIMQPNNWMKSVQIIWCTIIFMGYIWTYMLPRFVTKKWFLEPFTFTTTALLTCTLTYGGTTSIFLWRTFIYLYEFPTAPATCVYLETQIPTSKRHKLSFLLLCACQCCTALANLLYGFMYKTQFWLASVFFAGCALCWLIAYIIYWREESIGYACIKALGERLALLNNNFKQINNDANKNLPIYVWALIWLPWQINWLESLLSAEMRRTIAIQKRQSMQEKLRLSLPVVKPYLCNWVIAAATLPCCDYMLSRDLHSRNAIRLFTNGIVAACPSFIKQHFSAVFCCDELYRIITVSCIVGVSVNYLTGAMFIIFEEKPGNKNNFGGAIISTLLGSMDILKYHINFSATKSQAFECHI